MMDKPIPKREVAIISILHDSTGGGVIIFQATNDAVTEFEDFGVLKENSDTRGGYELWVDARYDFDEVLAYIENYG